MPRYTAQCQGPCQKIIDIHLTFDEYEQYKHGFLCGLNECSFEDIHQSCVFKFIITEVPSVHFKGYGFYATDNASPEERFNRDHYDGSGRNAEMKAIERRIKHPESTLPPAPSKK